MGIFRRGDGRRPTEDAVAEPGADDAVHGTSRDVGDAGYTDSTAREDLLAVPSKVIGPNVPVAGVLDGDASPSGTSRGTESTKVAKETPVEPDGHVKGSEKVEGDVEDEVEDESKYPKGITLAILTFGLCMATFVVSKLCYT